LSFPSGQQKTIGQLFSPFVFSILSMQMDNKVWMVSLDAKKVIFLCFPGKIDV
jgi:hypothetical protein